MSNVENQRESRNGGVSGWKPVTESARLGAASRAMHPTVVNLRKQAALLRSWIYEYLAPPEPLRLDLSISGYSGAVSQSSARL
jgi:hypothetical protein